MEYIYGFEDRNGVIIENLKTIGDSHSELSGFIQTIREYSDAVITDMCCIVEHYKSEEDVEGGCYDWYRIGNHWRNIDRFTPVKQATDASNAAAAIAFVTMAENGSIDDVTAGEHIGLFAEWQTDIAYRVGSIRQYEGLLYRCIQEHTSQADWTPDAAGSLWKNIADPAEEWPAWSQPVGAGDAYGYADQVSHGGKRWVSTVDNNVWEPGVYGWEESNEE